MFSNILGPYDDVKDAVQDVMTKYYASYTTGIDNKSNYLIRSVIKQSINLKKKNNRAAEPISTENQ